MIDATRHPGLDRVDTVSALGLRLAALRAMLASPLIEVEEHRDLRGDLRREMKALERELAALPGRNVVEVRTKIDLVQAALRELGPVLEDWVLPLLDSLKGDVQSLSAPAAMKGDIRSPSAPAAMKGDVQSLGAPATMIQTDRPSANPLQFWRAVGSATTEPAREPESIPSVISAPEDAAE